MLIVLTGLHSAGKGHFVENIAKNFEFETISKNNLIELICLKETGNSDWQNWYKIKFNSNPFSMTKKIIENLPDKDVILDSVHSNIEWDIIKYLKPDAMLALITTPKDIRYSHWADNRNLDEMDKRRIGFWHSKNDSTTCLLTEAGWSFNGAASIEANTQSFKDLVNYMKSKNIKQEKKENTLPLSEQDNKLLALITESSNLTKKLALLNKQIEDIKTNNMKK